jgi:hypothetical protein
MMADAAADSQSGHPRYESRDATVWLIVLFGLGLCLTLVCALVGGDLILAFFAEHRLQGRPTSATALTTEEPPRPRLQIDPAGDLNDLRRAEDTVLHSYGWIDRQTGTVRIPIDRAMDLLAGQRLGFPAEDATGTARGAPAPGSR